MPSDAPEIGVLRPIPFTQGQVAERLASPANALQYLRMSAADANWLAVQLCIHAGRTGNWRGLRKHLELCQTAINIETNRAKRPGP